MSHTPAKPATRLTDWDMVLDQLELELEASQRLASVSVVSEVSASINQTDADLVDGTPALLGDDIGDLSRAQRARAAALLARIEVHREQLTVVLATTQVELQHVARHLGPRTSRPVATAALGSFEARA